MKQLIIISLFLTQIILANSNTIYCPEVSDLKKNGMHWHSKTITSWKSYESSFVDHVESFIGAQWNGIKVGTISCIYSSKEENVFPVSIQNKYMFVEPTQTTWKTGSDGYLNCIASEVKECPLTPYVEKKAPKDTEEILKQIRDEPNKDQQSNTNYNNY